MQMSDHELLYHYNHAVDQAAQVRILAELNAVDVPTMRNKLLDLGAQNVPAEREKVPRRLGSVTFDENRAMELYNGGCCDSDLARELGVSRNTVADWRKRNDLKINRKVPEKKPEPEPEPEPTELPEPAAPEEPPRMSIEGLLRVAGQMQEAFPQAEITVDGRYVREILVSVFYNADGTVDSAAMNLILED